MARAPVKAAAAQDLTFLWEGVDKRGKRVKGELRAPSDAIVKGELRKQGVIVGKVRKKPKPLLGDFGQKITSRDLMLFTRQLSTMLNSGVPVVQSLDMLVTGAKNLKLRELIREIKTDVESGLPLAKTIGAFIISGVPDPSVAHENQADFSFPCRCSPYRLWIGP